MENENIPDPAILGQLKSYLKVKANLEKLKTIRKGSPTVATAIIYAAGTICLILGSLFGCVTLAFYLGSLLGSLLAGFGCVAMLFILLGILLLISKSALQTPIVNLIIKKTCN